MTKGKRNQKQAGFEFKTFPVPFALEEIKQNNTFTTNKAYNQSKEQIINQAFDFHSKGNILEAANLYQYLINQGFKDHRVFSNYGVIQKNLGKLKKAELSYRKAIEIKPDYAKAHLNLGIILEDLGKLQEAFDSYLKAININPLLSNIYPTIVRFLRDSDISQLNKSKLKDKIINIRCTILYFLFDHLYQLLIATLRCG